MEEFFEMLFGDFEDHHLKQELQIGLMHIERVNLIKKFIRIKPDVQITLEVMGVEISIEPDTEHLKALLDNEIDFTEKYISEINNGAKS